MSLSKKEIKKIQKDREYWCRVGEILDLTLNGFTDRYSASFFKIENGVVVGNENITSLVAEKLIELQDSVDHFYDEMKQLERN